jgi:hypothetical protein
MKNLIITSLFTILLASCATAPATEPPDTVVTNIPGETMPTSEPFVNPLAPKPGDESLMRSEIYLQEASLLIRESFPPQV